MREEVTPEAVVRAFIAAMDRWETDSWNAMRAALDGADPESYSGESGRALADVPAHQEGARRTPERLPCLEHLGSDLPAARHSVPASDEETSCASRPPGSP